MADGSDWFVGLEKVLHHGHHGGVGAQVFGAPAARDHQGVVTGHLHVGKRGVECKVVAGFLAVGLCTFKVVDGGFDGVARLFVGAHRMDGVAHGQQCLERHHGFVVFAVVATNHQNFFRCHGVCLRCCE